MEIHKENKSGNPYGKTYVLYVNMNGALVINLVRKGTNKIEIACVATRGFRPCTRAAFRMKLLCNLEEKVTTMVLCIFDKHLHKNIANKNLLCAL